MTEQKQTINDFNREEMADILSYLYVQGSEIVEAQSQMTTIVDTTVKKRLKSAKTAKYNRNGNIGGIVFVPMGLADVARNFF